MDSTRPEPVADIPTMFGAKPESVRLPWQWVQDRMLRSPLYWITTALPGGRPHSRPVWAVFVDDRLRFSTGSLASAHLNDGAAVSVQIQMPSGATNDIVIIEGTVMTVTDPPLIARICDDYNAKYRYKLVPDALPGPFHTVEPQKMFGWTSDDSGLDGGAAFHGSVTRWRF